MAVYSNKYVYMGFYEQESISLNKFLHSLTSYHKHYFCN